MCGEIKMGKVERKKIRMMMKMIVIVPVYQKPAVLRVVGSGFE